MDPVQKLEWCMQILQFCFKLLFRDFQNGGNPIMHKLITFCLTLVLINNIYTIGFSEKDPFYIMMAIACSSSVVQVSRIDKISKRLENITRIFIGYSLSSIS